MPFCPTEPCPTCWCCLEIACRRSYGGCHDDPESENGKAEVLEHAGRPDGEVSDG